MADLPTCQRMLTRDASSEAGLLNHLPPASVFGGAAVDCCSLFLELFSPLCCSCLLYRVLWLFDVQTAVQRVARVRGSPTVCLGVWAGRTLGWGKVSLNCLLCIASARAREGGDSAASNSHTGLRRASPRQTN